ncbi:hypothetical protein T190130A13A_30207 [Tenacibaculum sp. 190130A14a]|uniref:Uncharacterized protein n=1 Tax=Tenacibaculum polynesiense TaxID=3137857 RepID=A0ABM9PBY2_9FLAO
MSSFLQAEKSKMINSIRNSLFIHMGVLEYVGLKVLKFTFLLFYKLQRIIIKMINFKDKMLFNAIEQKKTYTIFRV